MHNKLSKRKLVAVSFVFVLTLIFFIPKRNVMADTIASGDCGNNISWSLDHAGVLTISGSGDMWNWNDKEVPWVNYRNDIRSIVFSGNITSIGRYAFARCPNITDVVIPNTVKRIGQWAFTYDYGLVSVTIPNSVTAIGFDAFRQCTNLTSITIPNSVTSIGDCQFYGCTSLKSVTLPSKITYIDKQLFDGCTSLEIITIPNSVTSIGNGAFRNCKKLISIIIPDNVSSIGENAFAGCSGLTSIAINKNAYSQEAFPGLSSELFHYYYDITYANDGNGSISGTNRSFGTDIVDFTITPNSNYELDKLTLTQAGQTIELKPSLSGDYILPDADSAISISAAFKPIVIASGKCNDDLSTSDITWVLEGDGTLTLSGKGSTRYYGSNSSNMAPWYKYRDKIKKVIISGNITLIRRGAFSGCSNLVSVELPESLENISTYVFSGCTNLKSITIPNNVKVIDSYAFYGCTKLTSVKFPDSLEKIKAYAFENCTGLTSITIPNGVTAIEKSVFSGCTNLENVKIPNGATIICERAFANCTSLKSINIPNSINTIENSAFNGCVKLSAITIPNSITCINPWTFSKCSSLMSITIPKNVEWIGSYAFNECTSLTSVFISEGVTSIDSSAFEECSSLVNVSIPESVTSISENAFKNCRALKSVSIPVGVTTIGNSAFYHCGIETLSISKTLYDNLDDSVFQYNSIKNKNFIYTISVNQKTGGTVTVSKNYAYFSDLITVTATPATGYKLSCIRVAGTIIDGNTFTMPAKNISVDATFTKIDYAITVNTSTGGTAKVSKNPANIGDQITITTTPDTGYEIDTVKVNGTPITGTKFTMGAEVTTVDVTFKKSIYTIWSANVTNATVSISKTTANFGDEITVNVTPFEGYVFEVMFINGNKASGMSFTMPARDVVLDIIIKKIDYKIEVISITGGGSVTLPNKANYGDEITIETSPFQGYKLSSIKINGKHISGNTFTMPADDVTIEIAFTKIAYKISVTGNDYGTAKASKTSAYIGDEIAITLLGNAYTKLDYIKVNGETISGTTFTMPACDVTVEIAFNPIQFPITVNTDSNGTAELSATAAGYGDKITITATPATGYELDAIKVNGELIDGNTFDMLAENVTVYVSFRLIDYTIIINDTINGTVSVSQTTANYGDEITVTAIPDSKFALDIITVNGTAITGNTFLMPAENVTIEVLFVKNGWILDGGNYYFYDNGKMSTGWIKDGRNWYYLDPETGIMATGWKEIKGKWHYLTASGAMKTGWSNIGGKWYYFSLSGDMVIGWENIGNKWYYFASSGTMVTGWNRIGGTWYYFTSSGAMATDWNCIDGKWYYFGSSGAMVTGWKEIDGKWYFFTPSGDMVTGWKEINGQWYYFYDNGDMAYSTTIGGYEIDENGVWKA